MGTQSTWDSNISLLTWAITIFTLSHIHKQLLVSESILIVNMASSGRTTAVTGGTGTQSTPANNVGGADTARRNSNGTLFSGLINQKRNSQDPNAQARRESFNDMKPYWNNWKDVEQLHFRISTKVGPRLENMTGGVVCFYYVSMLNLANERAGRSERRCGKEKYLSVSCI